MSSAPNTWTEIALSRPLMTAPGAGRIEAIDWARGVAVTLMILNHGVKGLLPFEDYPDWGLVPLHMVTRFASSLFIMVFGVGLAVAFLPKVNTSSWPRRRLKLVLTGLVIYFWYKVLTVAEMLPYEPEQIMDALLYRAFPSFVEILGFYALALLWIPFFLPLWSRLPLWARLASPLVLALVSHLLLQYFHFWGSDIIQALLVEHEEHYTWGQLARAPLVLLGLLLGELILRYYHTVHRYRLAGCFAAGSAVLFGAYLILAAGDLKQELQAIAFNEGKHPPELLFMLFSMGGAFAILSAAIAGGEPLARWLKPVTIIGSDALKAFIFHIFVIFVLFRYLLGYWHEVSYNYALTLTLCLILATALWIKITTWVAAHR